MAIKFKRKGYGVSLKEEYHFPINKSISIAMNKCSNILYICDVMHQTVQICSLEGYSVTSFGKTVLQYPWGIALHQDYIFVTDFIKRAIFRFDDYGYIKVCVEPRCETERAMHPLGAVCDENANVYFTDDNNKIILRYNSQMECTLIFSTSKKASPVDIKLSSNKQELIVLFNAIYFICFFNLKGKKIRDLTDQSNILESPLFFCLDLFGNFIISDFDSDTVFILDSQGKLKCKQAFPSKSSKCVLVVESEGKSLYIVHHNYSIQRHYISVYTLEN